MLAGGGTGGHLFPGIAVVQELRRRASVIDVVFVGTAKGLEARLLPTLGESLALIDVRPLKGRGLGERWRSLCALPTALWQARALVAQHRPDVVLGLP
ncbi:MAG: glycosyltransferase, partial [Polyangiales bacterium]